MPYMLALLLTSVLALTATTGGSVAKAPAKHAAVAAQRSAWRPVVPFIEDDYPRAVALAKARKVPVFIEAWAPW